MKLNKQLVQDKLGNARVGVPVTVYVSGTQTRPILYAADDTGGDTLGNPLNTDNDGYANFYVVDGVYDIVVGTGTEAITYPQVQIYDLDAFKQQTASDAADAANVAVGDAATAAASIASTTVRQQLSGFTLAQAAEQSFDAAVTGITVSGAETVGDAGAGMPLVYDATVDAAYVAAHPTTSFLDAGGRGFRQARRKAADVDASDGNTVQANIDRMPISPEQYGAKGDAVYDSGTDTWSGTDDTAAWIACLAAGKSILARKGAVYYTTASLGAPLDGATIDFNGSKIVGDWEQSTAASDPDAAYEAIFYLTGLNNVTFKNGEIEYVGTFNVGDDPANNSYTGLVSCIHANECDNLTIDNCEIHGGNRGGVLIGALIDQTADAALAYSLNPRVLNCDVHHCRVGCVIYGRTDLGLVQGNQLRFAGHPDDIGTGYGFAGYSTGVPKGTSVIGNHAVDNYRKGIDWHSGISGVVANNVVLRNRCDGIYVMGVSGSWTITGNVIADMLWTGEYPAEMCAIRLGELVGQGTSEIPTSFNVTGNTVSNFTSTGGNVYPIFLGGQGLSYGKFNLSNNILSLGRVTKIIECQPTVTGSAGNYFDISFDSNQIYCAETVGVPFTIRGTFNRKKSFSGNQIEIAATDLTTGVLLVDNTAIANNSLIASGNDLTVPASAWSAAGGFDPIQTKRTARENVRGNTVNGAPWRDWDGTKFIGRGTGAAPGNDVLYWTAGSRWETTAPAAGASPGGVCTTAGFVAAAWVASTAYPTVGQQVTNDSGKVYKLITAGTSASSGGPTGTATSGITDGTDPTACVWGYIGTLAVFKALPAIAA